MRRARLEALNPLAKVAGPAPAAVVLVIAQDPWFPGIVVVAVLLLLLLASRVPFLRLGRTLLGLVVGLPALTVLFALAPAAGGTTGSPLVAVGPVAVYPASLLAGATAALKIGGLLGLALLGGLTTGGPDLVRALVQNARVPYRFGYATLAAFRFVPRYRHELGLIRAAQRIRGVPAPRGPVGAVRRTGAAAVPLLAGGVRHAERVGLAMDARAFGAYQHRTERIRVRVRPADVVFVAACWAGTTAGLVVLSALGLRAPFVFW